MSDSSACFSINHLMNWCFSQYFFKFQALFSFLRSFWSIIFCRMQEIWGDIFTLSHSWQQSIVTLQYYAVQTRAFLGKEGVYTLVYSATKILKYWGCFLSLVMHVRKHMTSSDRENVPYWALLFGGSLKLQITATVTQRMLQNSKETKAKARRSLLFWSTFTSLTLSKVKNKPI